MSNFVLNGNTITLAGNRGNEIAKIPAGVYMVKFHPQMGFFLNKQEDLGMPSKTYGESDGRAQMVMNTFLSREGVNTGVLLTGNKGSGKTLLAKMVCALAIENDMPVILMEEAFGGGDFTEFMNSITQRCIVFIDEFEKKYKTDEHQNCLLSLLDGTGVNNKLFMLTSNSAKVSEFLLSRPSRLFYHWGYGKLEEAVLEGYCKDNLKDPKHIDNMRTLWNISTDISFDVMQAIVEELNRYPEMNFVDAICNMNVSLGDALRRRYNLREIKWGDEVIPHGGSQHMLNMIEVQNGETRVRAASIIKDWMTHVEMMEAIPGLDAYNYNGSRLSQVKEGKLTHEEVIENEDFHYEFNFNYKFESATDSLSVDELVFRREVNGKPMVITFKHLSEDPIQTHFRRLFK